MTRLLKEYGNGTGETDKRVRLVASPHGEDRSEAKKLADAEAGRKKGDVPYVPWVKRVVRAVIVGAGAGFRDLGLAYRGETPEPLKPLAGGRGGAGRPATKSGGMRRAYLALARRAAALLRARARSLTPLVPSAPSAPRLPCFPLPTQLVACDSEAARSRRHHPTAQRSTRRCAQSATSSSSSAE